jgi:hypothetical protein
MIEAASRFQETMNYAQPERNFKWHSIYQSWVVYCSLLFLLLV